MTIPFVVLPASVWRIAVGVFFPPEGGAGSGDLPSWLPIGTYVVLLSIFSELLAMSAYGLVARWGEVFPAWVPFVRRKRVPVALGVVPACAGSAILTAVTLLGAVNNLRGLNVRGEPLPPDYPLHFRDAEGVITVLMYAPLLLWGPLLAVVTYAYWRRRAALDPAGS